MLSAVEIPPYYSARYCSTINQTKQIQNDGISDMTGKKILNQELNCYDISTVPSQEGKEPQEWTTNNL